MWRRLIVVALLLICTAACTKKHFIDLELFPYFTTCYHYLPLFTILEHNPRYLSSLFGKFIKIFRFRYVF